MLAITTRRRDYVCFGIGMVCVDNDIRRDVRDFNFFARIVLN